MTDDVGEVLIVTSVSHGTLTCVSWEKKLVSLMGKKLVFIIQTIKGM